MPSIINRRGRPPYPDILTSSEWQVLEGVRAGLTNQEIAVRLGVTFHTVKYHISNMLSKLHLEDRQQLAAWRPVGGSRRVAPSRSWRRFVLAPLGALKTAGAVGGVAALAVGIGAASIVTSRGLRADQDRTAAQPVSSQGLVGSLPTSAPAPDLQRLTKATTPGVSATFSGVGHARTGISISVELDQPLPARFVPGARDVVMTAYGPFGERVVSQRTADYPSDPDGRGNVWHVELEAEPLPADTMVVVVTIGEMELIGRGGVAAPPAPPGPWSAVIETKDAPRYPDISSRVPDRIDTGYGWAYVIDGVDLLGSFVGITYHAEGNIDLLRPEVSLETSLRFNGTRPHTEFVPIPPGANELTVKFGAALRMESNFAPVETGTLESGDWSITIPLE